MTSLLILGPNDLVKLIASTHLLRDGAITMREYCELNRLEDCEEAEEFMRCVREEREQIVGEVARGRN